MVWTGITVYLETMVWRETRVWGKARVLRRDGGLRKSYMVWRLGFGEKLVPAVEPRREGLWQSYNIGFENELRLRTRVWGKRMSKLTIGFADLRRTWKNRRENS